MGEIFSNFWFVLCMCSTKTKTRPTHQIKINDHPKVYNENVKNNFIYSGTFRKAPNFYCVPGTNLLEKTIKKL